MDIGATLTVLLTFPIANKEEYLKHLNSFRGLLITSDNHVLKLVLKELKFLSSESVFAQLVQLKYKYFIKRRLAGFDDEICPEVRESLLPVLKDRTSQSTEETFKHSKFLAMAQDYRRFILLKDFLKIRRYFFFKLDKKLLKFMKSKIRLYQFFFRVFKDHKDLLNRSKSYFESLLVSSLQKHAKTYRRNYKLLNFFELLEAKIKSVFFVLNVKPVTSAPMTPRKSPKKRDYYLNWFLALVDELVNTKIMNDVKELKKAFPPINKSFKMNRFYNHFVEYYKKFYYIRFFNKVEKKIKGKQLLDFLFTSELVKHGKKFSVVCKLRLILTRLNTRKAKQVYMRLEKVNKLFKVTRSNCLKAAKMIDKVRIRKFGLKLFGWGKIMIGVHRMDAFCKKIMKKVFVRVKTASRLIQESEEILNDLTLSKKAFTCYSLNTYAKNYNKFARFRNFLLSVYPQAVKNQVFKAANDLKQLKQELDLILSKNLLKQGLKKLCRKSSLVIKRLYWNKLKTCEKFYMFDFSDFKPLSNLSVAPSQNLLTTPKANYSSSASEMFLQLYSLINSSFTTQSFIYTKIDNNCSDLQENLFLTKESLSTLEDSISDLNSKICSINENKSKVFQSNQVLGDLLSKAEMIEEDYRKISKNIDQNRDLDNSLEVEMHQLTRSIAELSNACDESALEISRIEFDYSQVVKERDSFRMSPERQTRLGLSPSPGRRSPTKGRSSPLRDSFRSPVKSFVARSPISPERSRARTRGYEE